MKAIFSSKNICYIILAALAIRLISLDLYPLMDTTEARYGEIARIMLETNNWLTPQFDYNIPFWGKPPLFTWMSAFSAKILGISEFALRFPHWLAGIGVLLLVAFLAKKTQVNISIAIVALTSCPVFIISCGAIMTDMALTLFFTLAMVSFYLSWLSKDENIKMSKLWAYIAFIALGLGLLTKGPLILIMMGIAVMPFLVTQHGFIYSFKVLWGKFPIVSGIMFMLLISLPWYIMAEIATPGFLDYFIAGEHFKRFLVSGWEGDLYGTAHDEPLGMIWGMWLYVAFPYSLALVYMLWSKRSKLKSYTRKPLFVFSLCWLLSPLFLFTFSANILSAYVLPSIPALGILLSILIESKDYKWFIPTACLTPLVLVIALPIVSLFIADTRSDKDIFGKINSDIAIYYIDKRPFSGRFYSNGQAKLLENIEDLNLHQNYYLIGKSEGIANYIEQNNLNCLMEFVAFSERTAYLCTLSEHNE